MCKTENRIVSGYIYYEYNSVILNIKFKTEETKVVNPLEVILIRFFT